MANKYHLPVQAFVWKPLTVLRVIYSARYAGENATISHWGKALKEVSDEMNKNFPAWAGYIFQIYKFFVSSN